MKNNLIKGNIEITKLEDSNEITKNVEKQYEVESEIIESRQFNTVYQANKRGLDLGLTYECMGRNRIAKQTIMHVEV